MRPKVAHSDRIIERIATRQHGVVALAQLYRAGLSPDAVKHRVRVGRLHRIHRGVYAVGRAQLGREGRWKAATLALGHGAALSHRSAAELWGLMPIGSGLIHVTVPRRGGRLRREGLRVHRSLTLISDAMTLRHGIAVTSPRRTLADLRRVVRLAELRDVIRAAEIAGLPIGEYGKLTKRTRSELELRLLELIRRHRLPRPEVNVAVAGFVVDFLWRERGLIVETDGERFHRGPVAASEDRTRDHRLRQLGYEVLRFSYWQVVNETGPVVALLSDRLTTSA